MTEAYFPDGRWSTTASGPTAAQGTPITLTWSLVPDDTPIRNEGASNLISYFDDLFNVAGTGGELTGRPWFHLFEESFHRWSQLGGITFVYEPNDDGAELPEFVGSLGLRGDVRIGGALVDGPLGTLAYTSLPDSGDLVIDTGETNSYSNPANNYRQFRNAIMHELGHSFGLLHIESPTDALLMEPFLSAAIDGPQLDDVRGIHGLYGDAFEKSNGGLGNGTAALATSMGDLAADGSLAIGSDAVGGQAVSPGDTNFVSISSFSDADFYSFTISEPTRLDVTLTPLGGIFSQGVVGGAQSMFNANARSDLSLAVFASNGATLLGSANLTGVGQEEAIVDLSLATAGTYFAQVTGASINVQLYQLQLAATALPIVMPGDYNQDSLVDAADFVVWRSTMGQSGSQLFADGNGNGTIDAGDYEVWRTNFGRSASSMAGSGSSLIGVPEPSFHSTIVVAALVLPALSRAIWISRT